MEKQRLEAFKAIVKQGEFNLKGEAILAVASLFQDFYKFNIDEYEKKASIKDAKMVKEPIKKVKK